MLSEILYTEAVFRVCGVDPGTRFTGVCMVDVLYPSFDIVDVQYTTINSEVPGMLLNQHSNFPEVSSRVFNIYDQLLDICRHYFPTDFVVESPFFNHRNPGAYGPLSECFNSIKRAAFDYDKYVRFDSYSPAQCKKAVNIKLVKNRESLTNKEIMRVAIESTPIRTSLDYSLMNEHEIDAMAVAIKHISRLKEFPVLLCLS